MNNLQEFDLTKIEPCINIIIVGDNMLRKEMMEQTILQILRTKMNNNGFGYKMYESHNTTVKTKRYYTGKDTSIRFRITILIGNEWFAIDYSNYDLVFVHSQFENKNLIMDKYNILNDIINYSSEDDFFVIQKENIQICKPETYRTYFELHDKNPFCYNNILKLKENIIYGYSVFHIIDGSLHKKLQLRLKDLDIIHFIVFCVENNENNNVWLPKEINLEIINLICLSIKNEI